MPQSLLYKNNQINKINHNHNNKFKKIITNKQPKINLNNNHNFKKIHHNINNHNPNLINHLTN